MAHLSKSDQRSLLDWLEDVVEHEREFTDTIKAKVAAAKLDLKEGLGRVVRPELRATGYGFMNLVSISCGGLADWGFGLLRDAKVPLQLIFGAFAGVALLSVGLVLLIRPAPEKP